MSSSHPPVSPQQQQSSSSSPSQQENPPAAQHSNNNNNNNNNNIASSNSNNNNNNISNTPSYTSSQFGDTTLTKVFVGGLAWETTRDGVRHYFEQFGEILEAVVITDKATGRSKGYGFVTFRDPEGAKRACENPTPIIEGRRANCNLASLGVRQRPATPQHGGRFRGGSGGGPGRSPARIQTYSGGATSPHNLAFPYHQGFPYSGYGYNPYPQEYLYPPNMIYNGQFFVSPPFPPPMYGSAGGGGGGGPPPPPPTLGNPAATAAGIFPYHHPNQGFPFHQPVPYQQHHHHQPPPSGELSPNRNVTGGSGGQQPDQQPHDDVKPNNRQERSL